MQKWDYFKNQVVDLLGRDVKDWREKRGIGGAITSNRLYTPPPAVNITFTFNQYLLNNNVCL